MLKELHKISQYFDALENPTVSDYRENALESPETLGAFSTSILKNILPSWIRTWGIDPAAYSTKIVERPEIKNPEFIKMLIESPTSRFHDWREHLGKMSPKQFKGISNWLNALVGHHETLEALYEEQGTMQDLGSKEWSDIVNEIAGEYMQNNMSHNNWGVMANMSNMLTQMDSPLAREFYINTREDQPEDVFLKSLGIDFGETVIPERAIRLIEGLPNPDDYTLGQVVDTLLQRDYMEQPLIQLIRDAIKKDTKTIPNRPHFLKKDDVEENE